MAGNLKNVTVPYNFVPIAEDVLCGEIVEVTQDAYKQHVLEKGEHTGYIELDIVSKTPLFIGGNGEKFFAPSGEPIIPGSTIRGMVKNLFKIITFGSMRPGEDIEDKTIYFRGLAARGSIGRYYKDCMIHDEGDFTDSNALAGFLIKIKNTDDYYICPAQCERKPGDIGRKEVDVDWPETTKAIKEGRCKIHTGPMFSKKHYYEIFAPDWSVKKRIYIPNEVVQGYDNDRTENDKLTRKSLRKMAKEGDEAIKFTGCDDICFVVPCFYVAERRGGKTTVKHFGHGKYYRIPYRKTIADHVPLKVRSDKVADLADMIFGRTEMWGSRVFFEDAVHTDNAGTLEAANMKLLLAPKPTSFQLYLEQPKNATVHNVFHWDKNSDIRGYKLYWHQSNSENRWKLNGIDNNSKKIQPLAEGNTFKGRIRFNNLSSVELGALLSVFDLEKKNSNICYKLGMGKPLGLGSVSIKAKLHLFNEQLRYGTMFEGDDLAAGDGDAEQQWNNLVAQFTRYRERNFSQRGQMNYALTDLKTMLNFNIGSKQKDWSNKMAYMPVGDDRYKNRAVLNSPGNYVKQKWE